MTADPSHLTSLFQNATEGIVLTDGKGNIVLVNPAAGRIFGYNVDELVGNPIEVLIPEKVRPHHHKLRDGFYHSPSNRQMGHGRDLYGKRKDGSNIPVEVSLSFYEKNSELFVIAFIVDITERKRHEQSILDQQQELENMTHSMRKLNTQLEAKVEERTLILREALQKLEESQKDLSEALDKEKHLNEIKSRFVSMASHEFRTPLSTILSSASLLSKYTKTEEQDKRDRHVTKIKNSVKQLNEMLEDFLSLGKLDEAKIQSMATEFSLPDLVNDTVEEMREFLKKGQGIAVQHEGAITSISDPKLLKNVIINLLSNALKFSGEDKMISLFTKAGAEGINIIVMDEGIGIPEEDKEHLYSSFYRATNAVNIEGTGLGLHIIKRYIDLLNGHIYLESTLNEGTQFHIFIPTPINSQE